MEKTDNALIVIPARAGSKGIPQKNVKHLWGKPLLQYSISSALDDGFNPQSILLSSDGEEILAIGKKCGINCRLRPAPLARDNTSTEAVLLHHLEEISAEGSIPEWTILLQPTSPLRKPGQVLKALEYCIAGGFDSLLSVRPFHGFVWRREENKVQPDYDPAKRPRRQELVDRKFLENGSIYVCNSTEFLRQKTRLFGRIGLFEMSTEESLEIDDQFDWKTIEARSDLQSIIFGTS